MATLHLIARYRAADQEQPFDTQALPGTPSWFLDPDGRAYVRIAVTERVYATPAAAQHELAALEDHLAAQMPV